MTFIKPSLVAVGAVCAVAGLGACSTYDDGYGRSSVSIGVSLAPSYFGSYRDRDGDGVPNRFDRDRDGDGIPNRFDRRPNNPYRP